MIENIKYKHLRPKPGSKYRQFLVNGRIRAEVLYRETIGPDPLTPEQVAAEYDLPLDAVLEAIDYCAANQQLLDADRRRESARITAAGRNTNGRTPRAIFGSANEALPRRR